MFGILKKGWGFKGFVRSDLGSRSGDPVAAFDAGLDALKPTAVTVLLRAVADHVRLPMARLNDAVRRILTPGCSAYGIIEHPPTGHTDTPVTSAGAARGRAADDAGTLDCPG